LHRPPRVELCDGLGSATRLRPCTPVWRWDRLTCRPNCVGLSLGVAVEELVDGARPMCDDWAQFLPVRAAYRSYFHSRPSVRSPRWSPQSLTARTQGCAVARAGSIACVEPSRARDQPNERRTLAASSADPCRVQNTRPGSTQESPASRRIFTCSAIWSRSRCEVSCGQPQEADRSVSPCGGSTDCRTLRMCLTWSALQVAGYSYEHICGTSGADRPRRCRPADR
jgi:hypothetical protein